MLNPKLIFCLALILGGGFWTARADEPKPIQPSSVEKQQLEAQQQELCTLLIKSGQNSLATNISIIVKRQPSEDPRISSFPVNENQLRGDSLYLTKPENAQLLKLLSNPKVAKAISHELALTVLKQWVKQWEMDGTLPRWHYVNLMAFVNQTWPHDQAVIALFREALVTGGDVAIWDLWTPAPGAWDDVMLEPAVRFMEKTAAGSGLPKANPLDANPSDVVVMAFGVLTAHYSVWATNKTIPPRLSKVVLTVFPFLTNASIPPHMNGLWWCNDIKMLGGTHDPAMISVLRPYLKQKELAEDPGGLGFGVTTMRICDEAALAINSLLNLKPAFPRSDLGMYLTGSLISTNGTNVVRVRSHFKGVDEVWSGHDPAWKERDKKIAELEITLDTLAENKGDSPATK